MRITNSITRDRRAVLSGIAAVLFISLPGISSAADDLPVGINAESTFLTAVLKVAAVAWGALLLVFGARIPRFTLMSFFMVMAVPIGLVVAGNRSYLLAFGVMLVVLAVAAATVVWARRLAVGAACIWTLPALYVAHLFFSGSFGRNMVFLFGLAAAGLIVGALQPRIGTALSAAMLGTALLLVGLPVTLSFWLIAIVACGSLIGQLLVILRLKRSEDSLDWVAHRKERRRPRLFTHTFNSSAAVLTTLVLVIMVCAPQYGPGAEEGADRVARLIEHGALTQPGLILSKGHNLYLSGRATPIAIVAPNPGLLSRLMLPFTGKNPSPGIREIRAVKQADELEKMRQAAAITSKAFAVIAPMIKPGVNEAEIEAAIIDTYRRNGASGIAFDSIVGSGANAVLPHYSKNDAVMTEGMVVIDIGCSVDGYASDMTRSFPVNGVLSPEEQELVDTVNAAGDAARAMLKAGVTMRDLNRAARAVIHEAGFGPYFLHGLGHHVGLDVHDPPVDELQAGMVITIEPGIYIAEGSDVNPAYWNLGVRIEDSYIVTEDGYEEITSFPR